MSTPRTTEALNGFLGELPHPKSRDDGSLLFGDMSFDPFDTKFGSLIEHFVLSLIEGVDGGRPSTALNRQKHR